MATCRGDFSVAQDTAYNLRLRNTTDGSTIVEAPAGTVDHASGTTVASFSATIFGLTTIASPKTIQVQGNATTGSGTTIVYCSQLVAIKLTSYA